MRVERIDAVRFAAGTPFTCGTITASEMACTRPSLNASERYVIQLFVFSPAAPADLTVTAITDSTGTAPRARDNNSSNNRSALQVPVMASLSGRVDLSVAFANTPAEVTGGTDVPLQVTVRNSGDAEAPDALLRLTMPAGVVVAWSTSERGCVSTLQGIDCTRTQAFNSSTTYTFKVRAPLLPTSV